MGYSTVPASGWWQVALAASLMALTGQALAGSACGAPPAAGTQALPPVEKQGMYLHEQYTDAQLAKPAVVTFSRRLPRCIEVMGTDGLPFTACQYSSSKTQASEQARPDLALQLKMDMYRPPEMAPGELRPTVVWVHGGMFLRGGRNSDDSPKRARDWARAGYVVAVPNYRLTPYNNIWPGNVLSPDAVRQGAVADAAEDVRNAVRYLRANAARWGIDATRIAVIGDTAGGALSLMNAALADGLDDDVADGPDFPGVCSRAAAAISTGATLVDRGVVPSGEQFDAGDSPVQLFHARIDPHTGATWDGEVATTCQLFIDGGGSCERVQHERNTHSVTLNLTGPYAPDLRDFLWRTLRLAELPIYTP